MGQIQSKPTRDQMLGLVALDRYEIHCGSASLSSVDSEGYVTIDFPDCDFWITDMQISVIDAEGNDVLNSHTPSDNLNVYIKINKEDFVVNENIPMSALIANSSDNTLFMGRLIRKNEKITFKMNSNRLDGASLETFPNGISKYPLFCRVIIKGYAF
jgi:hypothetical protein